MGAQSKKSPKSGACDRVLRLLPGLMRSEVRVRHSIRRKKKACWRLEIAEQGAKAVDPVRDLHSGGCAITSLSCWKRPVSRQIQRFDRIERVEIGAANQQRFASGRSMELACSNTSGGGTREIFWMFSSDVFRLRPVVLTPLFRGWRDSGLRVHWFPV